MSNKELSIDEVSSWQTAAEYLDKHPEVHSYALCSYGRIGYLLVRSKIKGVYLQNTYDGSILITSIKMDTNQDIL
jgi:hypothetical protein